MDTQIRSLDDLLIDAILAREGSTFTDDPADRGGATKFGITQRAWDLYIDRVTMRTVMLPHLVHDITEDQARAFYATCYVAPLAWINDIRLRDLMVDSAVNCGADRSTKWLQRAAACTAIDGVIGPETRKLVNSRDARGLVRAVVEQRVEHYINLVVADPAQLKFLRGWWFRVKEFIA